MKSVFQNVAVAGALAAGMVGLSAGAEAIVAVPPISVQIAGSSTQTINNAWAVVGQHIGSNFVGDAEYLGSIQGGNLGGTTLSLNGVSGQGGYAALIGVSASGSDVVLGLNTAAASSAITNNTSLDTYTNDISSYLPTSFSVDGNTVGIALSLPNSNIKSDVISILNGTFSAPVSLNGIPIGNADVIPYSINLGGGPTTIISKGTQISFSSAWSNDIASYGIAFGPTSPGNGTLVDFDAPTNVGSFTATVLTPEPASLGLLAGGAVALLALRRRRLA